MVKRGVVRCLGRIVWYDVCRSIPQCIPLYCVSFAVLAVLELGALLLALHDQTGRKVGQTHG